MAAPAPYSEIPMPDHLEPATIEAATRFITTRCDPRGSPTLPHHARHRRCHMSNNQGRKRPCRVCNETTQTKDAVHHRCLREFEADFGYGPFDGLPRGRWLPRTDGVLIWVEDDIA